MTPRVMFGSISDINDNTDTWKDCKRCSEQFIPADGDAFHVENEPRKYQNRHHLSDWTHHVAGSLIGLCAGLFLTLGYTVNGFVKSTGTMEACGLRSLFAAVVLLPFIAAFKPRFEVDTRTQMGVIALSMVFATKFMAFAVGSSSLPIAEFSLLANTVPIYTAALGCVFLRERCLKKALACVVATTGVLTVCFPSLLNDGTMSRLHMSQQATGYACTLLAALANAIALVWLRRLGSICAMWVSLYASVSTSVLSVLAAAFTDKLVIPEAGDLLYVACAGVCTLMQSYLPAIACVLTEASRVAVSMTLSVVFAFIIQATVQQRAPSSSVYFGSILVIAAIVISSTNWKFSLKKKNSDEEQQTIAAPIPKRGGWGRYGAVALIGSPDSGRLCSACRLTT